MLPLFLATVLTYGATMPLAAPLGPPPLLPPPTAGGLPLDGKDHLPVLLGPASAEAILQHREVFRSNLARTALKPEWKARWKGLDAPCVLVAAFGSWCGDSHEQLPDLLALMKEPNPFVEVRLVGVYRDKKLDPAAWGKGLPAQALERVSTFWVFAQKPGGGYQLVGSVVETPRPGQRMAEALLELLEKAR